MIVVSAGVLDDGGYTQITGAMSSTTRFKGRWGRTTIKEKGRGFGSDGDLG